MKKIEVLLPAICLATLTLSSMSARADGLNLAPYAGKTISMTVEPYASGESNGSFYVGLTQVNLAFGGTSIGSVEAFCDDFNHEISVPATYNATVTAVAGNTLYEEEAYYGMEFGATPSGNSTLDSELQELIWNLSSPGQFVLNGDMTTLQKAMQANYSNVNYSNSFYLNAGDGGQSFMIADPSPVPEPSTFATFGTGLFAAAGFARRRFLRS